MLAQVPDFRTRSGFGYKQVVVEIKTDIEGFRGVDRHDQIGAERMQRRRQQARLLLRKNLRHGTAVVSRPRSLVRHLIAPEERLTIAFRQSGEGAARPERISDVPNGAFHATLLIAGADLTGTRDKMVMSAEFQQAWVEVNLVAAALQHRTAEIVIENYTGLADPVLESMDMAAQKV